MKQNLSQSRNDVSPFSGGPQGRVANVGQRPTRPFGPPLKGDRRGYTLIEVLVVAVVVVLMLGMALPVFRVITGSRSEAGATNIIASMLNRARTDAIGLQQPYGMAVIYNASTQQTSLAEVCFAPIQSYTAPTPPPNGYGYTQSTGVTPPHTVYTYNGNPVGGPPLDIVPDTDLVPLPAGICAQTVYNCNYSGSVRVSDGYLSLGVILFDGKGRLASLNYGIAKGSQLARATGYDQAYPSGVACTFYGQNSPYNGQILQLGVPSQFGLVVFQRDAWLNQKSPTFDAVYIDNSQPNGSLPDYNGSATPTQKQEETWLDQNSTPLLIDRYTGTLIKAE